MKGCLAQTAGSQCLARSRLTPQKGAVLGPGLQQLYQQSFARQSQHAVCLAASTEQRGQAQPQPTSLHSSTLHHNGDQNKQPLQQRPQLLPAAQKEAQQQQRGPQLNGHHQQPQDRRDGRPAAQQPAEVEQQQHTVVLPNHKQLEALVRSTKTSQELADVYHLYKPQLGHSETVLCCNQLAAISDPSKMNVKLWSHAQGLLLELLQHVTDHMAELTCQEFMVVLAMVAKLRQPPSPEWLTAFFHQSHDKLNNAGPGYLTTLLQALSRLQMEPHRIKSSIAWSQWITAYMASAKKHLPAYRGDQLIKTLVALGDLKYRPPPDWMAGFSHMIQNRLDSLDASALSQAMLAFSNLKYTPESPFMKAYYLRLYQNLPMCDDRDLATVAHAVSTTDRLLQHGFLKDFLAEVLQKLPTFKPAWMANLLAALGRLYPRHAADPEWVQAVGDSLADSKLLERFSGSALASATWGLACMKYPASQSFKDNIIMASYGKLHSMRPADLVCLLLALGTFGYTPSPGYEQKYATWFGEFCRLAARKSYDTASVCDLMVALSKLRVRPDPAFLNAVLRQTRVHNLRSTSATRLAALAGALHQLGVQPDFGFLYNYGQAARYMWTSFSAAEYATVLSAMTSMGSPLLMDPMWASEFLAIMHCRMSEFDGASLAGTLSALALLPRRGFAPSQSWMKSAALQAAQLWQAHSSPHAQKQKQHSADRAEPLSAAYLDRPQSRNLEAQHAAQPSSQQTQQQQQQPAAMEPSHLIQVMSSLVELEYKCGEQDPLLAVALSLVSTSEAATVPIASSNGTGRIKQSLQQQPALSADELLQLRECISSLQAGRGSAVVADGQTGTEASTLGRQASSSGSSHALSTFSMKLGSYAEFEAQHAASMSSANVNRKGAQRMHKPLFQVAQPEFVVVAGVQHDTSSTSASTQLPSTSEALPAGGPGSARAKRTTIISHQLPDQDLQPFPVEGDGSESLMSQTRKYSKNGWAHQQQLEQPLLNGHSNAKVNGHRALLHGEESARLVSV